MGTTVDLLNTVHIRADGLTMSGPLPVPVRSYPLPSISRCLSLSTGGFGDIPRANEGAGSY